MRIVLIADIHGNLPALDAVLSELEQERIDRIICLGDVSAMGPFPIETLERVRHLDCPVIMGNGDAAMLQPPAEPEVEGTARRFAEMDRWSAEHLSSSHLKFIQTFRATERIELSDDQSLLCYHGSPRSHDDIISATTPEEDLEEMLDGQVATIMAGGHWHFQMLRRHKSTTLFNPGSVGLPYDFDAEGTVFIPSRAEYGIMTFSQGSVSLELRRLNYDSRITTQAMRQRGFPHAEWWAENWR